MTGDRNFPWRCPLCGWGCDDEGPDTCPRDGTSMTRETALQGLLVARLEVAIPCRVTVPKDTGLLLPEAARPRPEIGFMLPEHQALAFGLRAGQFGAWVTGKAALSSKAPGDPEARWRFWAIASFPSMAVAVDHAERVGAHLIPYVPPHSFAVLDWDLSETGEYDERFAWEQEIDIEALAEARVELPEDEAFVASRSCSMCHTMFPAPWEDGWLADQGSGLLVCPGCAA